MKRLFLTCVLMVAAVAAEGAVLRCVGPGGTVVAFSNIRCPAGTSSETMTNIREAPPSPPGNTAAPAPAAPASDTEALRQELLKPCQEEITPFIMRKHPKAVGQVSINFAAESNRTDTSGGPQLVLKATAQFMDDVTPMEVALECMGIKNRILGSWETTFKETGSKSRPEAKVIQPEEKKAEGKAGEAKPVKP